MLKNLKYIAAVGLIAFGYTNTANAAFGMGPNRLTCTAKAAVKSDPKSMAFNEKCIHEVDPNSIKNFSAAFVKAHCSTPQAKAAMKKDKNLQMACSKAGLVNNTHIAAAKTKQHLVAIKDSNAKR